MRRPKRLRARRRPVLYLETILAWADEHHARTGEWPQKISLSFPEANGETWAAIDAALLHGHRGLPGGSSLARLLADRRGHRHRGILPPLTTDQILVWADEHHAQTGRWPSQTGGPILGAAGESWVNVNAALRLGLRGLPGGSSLIRLLVERRGLRSKGYAPSLTEEQILAWAEAHRQRTGEWPRRSSGAVADAAGEKWVYIDSALRVGSRGLTGGSSLARLLHELPAPTGAALDDDPRAAQAPQQRQAVPARQVDVARPLSDAVKDLPQRLGTLAGEAEVGGRLSGLTAEAPAE